MNGISRSLSAMGAAVLAASMLITLAPIASAHEAYPPGWNTPTPASAAAGPIPGHGQAYPPGWETSTPPSGQVLYQFVPGGGGVRHRVVTPATSESVSQVNTQ
jgi:hypothetical protein